MDPSRRQITKIARNASHFVQSLTRQLGLGASEYELLHCIRKNPGIRPDTICQKLYMNKSAAAHLCTALERKGLVRREVDPEDTRRRLFYATEAAGSLKDDRAALEAFYYRNLMSGIDEEKLKVFLEVLDTVYTRSKTARLEDNRTLCETLEREKPFEEQTGRTPSD